LLGEDFSVTNALLSILTLVGIDIGLSLWSQRASWLDKLLEETPVLVVKDGKPLHESMAQERLDETEILAAARELQGLERLEQIKYAVLERDGKITVIPKQRS
jgi:uncharacterized membrane protein YcaP (DUF421 family)